MANMNLPEGLTQEKFDELAAKHGGAENVRAVATVLGPAVFRAPGRAEVKRAAKGGLFDPRMRDNLDAADQLARACVVLPDAATFDSWLDKRAALPLVFLPALLDLSGMVVNEEAGK